MIFVSSLFYTVLLSVFVSLLIYHLVFGRKVTEWQKSNITFLKPTFFIGHKYFFDLFEHPALVGIDRIYRENGDKDLIAFFVTFVPVIMLRDPQVIKKVLLTNSEKTFPSNFIPPEDDQEAQHMPTFTSNRAKWKVSRSIITPFFQDSKLCDPMFDKFKKTAYKMVDQIEKLLSRNEQILVKDLCRSFAVDSFSLWSYGVDASYHEKSGDLRLQKVYADFCDPSIWRVFTVYATMLCPISQYFREFRFIKRSYLDTMKSVVQEQVKFRDENQVNNNDFIDHLMDLRNDYEPEQNTKNQTGVPGICKAQMTACCMSTLFSGAVNVEVLCTMIIHLLSLHPKIQDKIKEELVTIMEKQQVSELTFEVIQDLQFTKQCVMETIRLYPPLSILFRRCTEDFQIPGTRYLLKKGDNIIYAPYSLHRDPKYYKDPDKFEPDRFSPENEHLITPESFLSFGIGLRKCTTWKIGISMVTIFAASIVQRYEIRPSSHLKRMEATDFEPRAFLNLPKENFLVDLIPRKT